MCFHRKTKLCWKIDFYVRVYFSDFNIWFSFRLKNFVWKAYKMIDCCCTCLVQNVYESKPIESTILSIDFSILIWFRRNFSPFPIRFCFIRSFKMVYKRLLSDQLSPIQLINNATLITFMSQSCLNSVISSIEVDNSFLCIFRYLSLPFI